MPDSGPALHRGSQLRRRHRRRRRAVRRRQQRRRTTAAARPARSSRASPACRPDLRPSPSATPRSAATASRRASSSATTATSSRTTAARRPARSSRRARAARAPRSAATASSSRRRSATTATRSPATAAARPARIESTGWTCTAVTRRRRRPAWSSRSSTATCSTTAPIGARRRGPPRLPEPPAAATQTGLVQTTLGADSEPVWAANNGFLTGATNFCWWYHETGCVGARLDEPLRQARLPRRGQQADDAHASPARRGLERLPVQQPDVLPARRPRLERRARRRRRTSDCDGTTGAQLLVHERAPLPVHLHGAAPVADVHLHRRRRRLGVHQRPPRRRPRRRPRARRARASPSTRPTPATLGLVDGGMYSIDLFQAERHTCASTYTLTLSGFIAHGRRSARPICGDGIVAGNEVCDDGTNDGSYGGCTARLHRPRSALRRRRRSRRHARRAVRRRHRTTAPRATRAAPTCKLNCGDGIVEAGEGCDHGDRQQRRRLRQAATRTARSAPRCGDGFKNGTEQCDDGKNDGSYGTCNPDCTLAGYCGDDHLQNPPEVCDQGSANSSTAYGMTLCTNRCTPAPYCGDKAVEGQFGETCDDGVNSGLPGSCTPGLQVLRAADVLRRRHHRGPRAVRRRRRQRHGEQQVRRPLPLQVRQRRTRIQASSATTASTTAATARATRTARWRATAATASRTGPRRATTARRTSRSRRPTAPASARRRAPSRRTAATAASSRSSASSATGRPNAAPTAR